MKIVTILRTTSFFRCKLLSLMRFRVILLAHQALEVVALGKSPFSVTRSCIMPFSSVIIFLRIQLLEL